MSFPVIFQIITRTYLWILVLAIRIFTPLLVAWAAHDQWVYISLIVAACIVFLAVLYFESNELVWDIRELCLYDIFIYSFGLTLFLSKFDPSDIMNGLTGAASFLMFGRLAWVYSIKGNGRFASWPVFGVLGWYAKRRQKAASTLLTPSKKQAWAAYAFMVSCLIAGFVLPMLGYKLANAHIGLLSFIATPFLAKRTLADMKQQYNVYESALKAKLLAEDSADKERQIATEKERSNQLLTAKNIALEQAHATISSLLAEQEKDKAEVKHLNRALLHAAHDLAQPLALLGFAGIRLVDAKGEQARELAKQELSQLTLNLADECNAAIYGAKVATKLALPQVKSFSINELLRELWFSWRDEAAQQGIDAFLMWPPGSPPLHVAGDPMLIGRVARNLILNAISYAGQGSNILFSVRKRKTHALVQVWNTGAGIAGFDTVDGEANFAAFAQQMLEEGERRGDSHGLGIDNVKHLSIALGLRVSLRSRVGVGTVFSFTIPLAEYKLMAYT